MKTIDNEKLISLFVSQCRSADLWVGLWDKNKDIGSAKNALTAIGKVFDEKRLNWLDESRDLWN